MKPKANRGDYARLRRKIFFQILLMLGLSAVTALTLRNVFRGHIGDWVVGLLQSLGMDWADAQDLYQRTIRNNMTTIIVAIMVVIFLVFLYIVISSLMKYFEEINGGIDKIIRREDEEIAFSREMEFAEKKLNHLWQTILDKERQAADAEQRKNDLVVYLAHDIKTPLTSVIGYLSLLSEAEDMPEAQRAKYIGITLEKAYRLEELMDELFEITRFNSQSILLEKEPFDLHYALLQMADEAVPLLAVSGKRVEVAAREALIVTGDANKLARVFNNILKNAIAYSDPDSVISIRAEEAGGQAVITFGNRGRIIPPGQLERIFEKFYRADESRATDTGGAGLGLSIAREIVQLHGGTITAQSERGETSFTVSLPL